MLNREKEWQEFSGEVRDHVVNYTVPQYGDAGADQASSFTLEDLVLQMQKYLNRAGKNMRGLEEQKRDMLKVAHYACMYYSKLQDKKRK
jgi:hypothetical protein